MRRREGAREVPSRTPPAATDSTAENGDMFGFRGSIDTTPESVRNMHAAMYRRLRRHMELHRSILTDDAWKLLTRVAFALYVDSEQTYELTPLPAEATEPSRQPRSLARRR